VFRTEVVVNSTLEFEHRIEFRINGIIAGRIATFERALQGPFCGAVATEDPIAPERLELLRQFVP
jgi:hypothetical protein